MAAAALLYRGYQPPVPKSEFRSPAVLPVPKSEFRWYVSIWCSELTRDQSNVERVGRVIASIVVVPLAFVADLFRGLGYLCNLSNGIPFWQKIDGLKIDVIEDEHSTLLSLSKWHDFFISHIQQNKPITREILDAFQLAWKGAGLEEQKEFVDNFNSDPSKEAKEIRQHLSGIVYRSFPSGPKVSQWLTDQELSEAAGEDGAARLDTARLLSQAKWFHATPFIESLESILARGIVAAQKPKAVAMPLGAYASTLPEVEGYGSFVLAFRQNIEWLSEPSYHGWQCMLEPQRDWVGFSESIPVDPEHLVCIINYSKEILPHDIGGFPVISGTDAQEYLSSRVQQVGYPSIWRPNQIIYPR
jgi:hypothetical protein